MAVETVKSASIIALEASSPGRVTTGKGAVGELKHIGEDLSVPGGCSINSKFFMHRVQTNIKVKDVIFEAEAMTAGKFDLGCWYGPDVVDASLRGTVIDQDFFASDIDAASAVARASVVNQSGNYGVEKRNLSLWEALGLSEDPGGSFDIIAVVHTTAIGPWQNAYIGVDILHVH